MLTGFVSVIYRFVVDSYEYPPMFFMIATLALYGTSEAILKYVGKNQPTRKHILETYCISNFAHIIHHEFKSKQIKSELTNSLSKCVQSSLCVKSLNLLNCTVPNHLYSVSVLDTSGEIDHNLIYSLYDLLCYYIPACHGDVGNEYRWIIYAH